MLKKGGDTVSHETAELTAPVQICEIQCGSILPTISRVSCESPSTRRSIR